MKVLFILGMSLLVFLSGCAQVPKESVELSTTVGRDVVAVQRAHRELAKLLFVRMRDDINRFIDDVYAPYQIRVVIEGDISRAQSVDAAEKSRSILLAINNAFKPGAPSSLQADVLEAMGFLVSSVRADIESKREELLKPISDQEAQVLAAIEGSYGQIVYGNSIVTGHLASIVKVQDAQNEVLNKLGLDGNLSESLGKKLAGTSDRIADLVRKAERTSSSVNSTLGSLKSATSAR